MRLKKMVEGIKDALINTIEYGDSVVTIEYELDSAGAIEVTMYSDDMVDVEIFDSAKYSKEYPNVKEFIEEHLPEWDDIYPEPYDEWTEHGFANEADYINWRFH